MVKKTVISCLIVFWLAGCALQPSPEPRAESWRLPQPLLLADDFRWWRSCIRMPMTAEQRPVWHLDALLADRVMLPVLSAEAQSIALWRFHRRAADDIAGHQFSLWFYTDEKTAQRIFTTLEDDALLAELHEGGHVQNLINDCGQADARALQASSDPAWDKRLQKSWPYFIMGASMHWLALIHDVSADFPQADSDVDALLAHYRQVHSEISGIWQLQGRHAYIHHLSALFAYQPLLMHF